MIAPSIRLRRILLPALALLLAALAGCSGKDQAKAPAAGPAAKAAGGRATVPVDVAPAAIASLEGGVDVTGTLVPKFKADVKSEYTGIVSDVYVTEWVNVRKGQPLAKIDTRETEVLLKKAEAAVVVAQSGLLQTRVAEARANREYARMVKLREGGLATQQALDEALTAKQAAEAQTEAVKAQIAAAEEEVRHARTRLAKSVILSPMNGMVSRRSVNVGDLGGDMGNPTPLFLIVDNSLLELTVTVPAFEMEKVRVGQTLEFSTDAMPGKKFTGRVKFINPMVNEADRSLVVVAEVNNVPEVLKSGLYVKGRILTERRENVLVIPRIALLNWDMKAGQAEVFVVDAAKVARKRKIGVGTQTGESVEVVAGLKEGEQVVTRGSFQVREGDTVAPGAR